MPAPVALGWGPLLEAHAPRSRTSVYDLITIKQLASGVVASQLPWYSALQLSQPPSAMLMRGLAALRRRLARTRRKPCAAAMAQPREPGGLWIRAKTRSPLLLTG